MSNLHYDLDDHPNDALMLEDARKSANPIRLAVCYLVRADGTASPAYFNPEFGDGEGTEDTRSFARRAWRHLKAGESLHVLISDFQPQGN